MSTSVLKALPGKLDIKRHSPSILYLPESQKQNNKILGYLLYQVGSLLDNKLKLDIDAIRDYDSNGQESMFPDLRIGQCPVGQECTECIKPDIEDSYLYIPGDLYVIGKV